METIKQILLTKNDCYRQHRVMTPVGIIVHSTGANNKKISRYLQPDDGIIGTNPNNNDWNRTGITKCVHAFIGVDKNGNVTLRQTLPWNYRCWGCGSGKNGSYNNGYIQFEICEDDLTNTDYFYKAFNMAADLCKHLMRLYPTIKPCNIISHKEANRRGYASNHADCDSWLVKFGKNMDWFRSMVAGSESTVPEEKKQNPYPTPTYTLYRYKLGMQTDFVKWLQWELNQYGGYGLVVDGKFGAATQAALKDAQKRLGLVVDGKCGSITRHTLITI